MAKNKVIIVKGTEIAIFQNEQADFISLTDIARYKDALNTDYTKLASQQEHN